MVEEGGCMDGGGWSTRVSGNQGFQSHFHRVSRLVTLLIFCGVELKAASFFLVSWTSLLENGGLFLTREAPEAPLTGTFLHLLEA